jgi:uncharacterized protein (TIGR04255 family)
MPVPTKLKHDAILEALLEVRFDPPQSLAPEVIVGKLVSCNDWAGLIQNRLPIADMPAPIRQADTTMRYQPIIELVNESRDMAIKVGERVLSLHVLKPYCGWDVFAPRLHGLVKHLFAVIPGVSVSRLGLRYINAFLPGVHGIDAVSSLQIDIKVADQPVSKSFNLNYGVSRGDDLQCLVKIASPDFVQGPLPKDASGFVDVDIFTPTEFKTESGNAIFEWLDAAHGYEKDMFFNLLSVEQIDRMNK